MKFIFEWKKDFTGELRSFYYIDMSISKIKKKLDEKQRKNIGMTSAISSLVKDVSRM